MLKHIAGFEVLPVKTRGLAIAPFADGFVGRKQSLHAMSPLVSGEKPLAFSGCEPAAARMRRALRATASSIIWPSTAPTPLLFSVRTARAFATASAVGVSALLIAPIYAG
jgi:hypothetical protein